VIAIDADPTIVDIPIDPDGALNYHNAAVLSDTVATNRKLTKLYLHSGDGQAHTTVKPYPGDRSVVVPTTSVPTMMSCYGVQQLDLLKLDCEGAEYEIMRCMAFWARTQGWGLARQISVEYHDHCGLQPEANMEPWYARLHAALSCCYDVAQHKREVPPWGGPPHYTDSLYMLRREFWK
jgi:FkbM family methyltransferase